MNFPRYNIFAVALLLLSASTPALAGINSFALTDGTMHFTLDNIVGHRTAGDAGLATLETQVGSVSQLNHMFQCFFWYRANGDTREYAMSNLTFASLGMNTTITNYLEPINNGNTPGALLFSFTYRLSDLTTAIGQPRAMLRIDVIVSNETAGPVTVNLFHYNDMDLNASSRGDSAALAQFDPNVQGITDLGDGLGPRVQATHVSSNSYSFGYQIAAYPTILNQLTNASAQDLTNTSPTFGPGDYSSAHQWKVTLGANSFAFFSIFMDVTVTPCPADINGPGNLPNGQVDVDDLLRVINSWGFCP